MPFKNASHQIKIPLSLVIYIIIVFNLFSKFPCLIDFGSNNNLIKVKFLSFTFSVYFEVRC